ncbi:MAG: hypothetical protein CM1200mP30_08800 [Pseudomonadota bacterium]|nr:MAG: hypothetical protein CM1200mP30_08800 [Pseudomonadota bacterium]
MPDRRYFLITCSFDGNRTTVIKRTSYLVIWTTRSIPAWASLGFSLVFSSQPSVILDRCNQKTGIGVIRGRKKLVYMTLFHNSTRIKNHDFIRKRGHCRKVVTNENERDSCFLPQAFEEFNNVCSYNESSAEITSSQSRTSGLAQGSARLILCFCPPESSSG